LLILLTILYGTIESKLEERYRGTGGRLSSNGRRWDQACLHSYDWWKHCEIEWNTCSSVLCDILPSPPQYRYMFSLPLPLSLSLFYINHPYALHTPHTLVHTHILTLLSTRTHKHSHIHTLTQAPTHTAIHTYISNAYIHSLTHTYNMHTYIHTYTYIPYIYIHTYIHTYTYIYIGVCSHPTKRKESCAHCRDWLSR